MNANPQPTAPVPALNVDLTKIPVLLDPAGVKKHLAPLGRTMLYELATQGEIETASLGMGRGKRVYVAASIVQWLQRRMAMTKRPNVADRRASAEAPNQEGAHK